MTDDTTAALAAARASDQATWGRIAEAHRGDLRLHCYRMLAAFHDAEDMVQETLLRAWRSRATFEGRAPFRAWLYGIATNACLDFLAKHKHRAPSDDSDTFTTVPPALAEVPWLQPYPDALLDPARAVAAKETIGLAFLAAVQLLPPRQRAALLLCDVLDVSAKEAGDLLGLSPASVNSALQRARATLRAHDESSTPTWKPGLDPGEQQRALLARYVSATDRGDAAGLAALLAEDIRFSMPPEPGTWIGRDTVVGSWVKGGFGQTWFGDMRALETRANGTPAVACYLRRPGQPRYQALTLDVLRIQDGLIAEIVTFPLRPVLGAFDLPAEIWLR